MPAANFLALEAFPHLLRTARPGAREGGQEPKEAFPGPVAVAMARPTGGHGQVQGREAISTAVSERERRLYLHLHDLALASCTAFAKPFLSYLQTLPSRVPALELVLARQVCSALAIDRICICIDVAAMLQVSFCRPCFLAFVASPRGCFVSSGGRGNGAPGALPFPVCKCRSQDEGARRLGKRIGVGAIV